MLRRAQGSVLFQFSVPSPATYTQDLQQPHFNQQSSSLTGISPPEFVCNETGLNLSFSDSPEAQRQSDQDTDDYGLFTYLTQ
jgi:hypothetical protein